MEVVNLIIIGLLSLLILVFWFKAPCKENFENQQQNNALNNQSDNQSDNQSNTQSNTQSDNQPNNQPNTEDNDYNHYLETKITKSGRDIDRLYQNYEGPKVGESEWENVTLNQCKFHCNNMPNCVGFVRPAEFASNDRDGTCSPRTSLNQCHTPLKGTNRQRSTAQGFNTYLKNSVPNQFNKCIGSAITLNRMVSLQSYGDPTLYVTSSNNEIVTQNKQDAPAEFFTNAVFNIVNGKAGVGTVSFEITQNNDNDRTLYIGHQYPKGEDLVVVAVTDESSPSDLERVSFRLVNGLADDHLLSFKLVGTNIDNNNLYVTISSYEGSNRVHIYEKGTSDSDNRNDRYDNEATFDIIDPVTNESLVEGCCYDNRRDIKPNNRKKIERFNATNNNQDTNTLHNNVQQSTTDANAAAANAANAVEAVGNAQEQNIGLEEKVKKLNKQNRNKESDIYNEADVLQNKITEVENLVKKLSLRSNSKDFFFLKSLEDKVLGEAPY